MRGPPHPRGPCGAPAPGPRRGSAPPTGALNQWPTTKHPTAHFVDEILGTAVDSSTWTTTLQDDALRHALMVYDGFPVYETSFTVTTTGEAQDLSSITALDRILAVAYPWTDGADFAARQRRIRTTDDARRLFRDLRTRRRRSDPRAPHRQPRHQRPRLGSAATTVPTHHARIIGLLAAAYACTVRARQISENPAIPRDALDALAQTAQALELAAYGQLRRIHDQDGPAWGSLGL